PLLQALVTDQDADVRRAVTYVAGVQGEPAKAVVATALEDVDPMVKRRALEALVRMGQSSDKPGLVPVSDILALLNDNDRFVRWAARTVLERTPRAEWKDHVLEETNPLGAIEGMVAWIRTAGSDSVQPIIDKQFTMVKESLSIENQLRLYRAIQLTAIDLPGGLPLERRRELYDVLAARFPAQDERLNRELSLLLAYTGQAGAVGEILAAMPTEHENQALQIWYAYTLRTVKDGWEAEQKIELARWFGQAAKWRGGSSYARYMGQLFDQSMEFFTEEERSAAAELAPDYAPLTPQELSQIAAREQQEQAGRGAGAGPGGRAAGARQSGQSQAAEPRSAGAQAQTAERPRPGTQTTLARRSVGVSRTSKEEIFEYQIFVPQRREPDPSEGRRIFESDCGSCHRFGGVGTDHGSSGPPSLTDITARATKREMLESILWPSDTVAAEHQTTTIETADGRTIKGLVLKEDAQTVTLKTTTDERPVEMPTAQIKSRSKTNSSIMPENLLDAYSQQQIAGLLAFLLAPPPAGATAQ
ncbi:MAG: HEAT repeat domain-containing protein, partial [Vicinamibacteraceae bacterium]